MKTLEQFIKEHLSKEEFIEQIKNMEDDDFRKLTTLYLRKDTKSFKDNFKEFCKEKNIPGIATFWSYFDVFSGRSEMITKMLEKSGDKYTNLVTIADLENNEKNIFDLIAKTIYPHNRNEKLKTKFISILKEIALDDKRTGKAAIGKFEHLLTLFLDGIIEPGDGDISLRTGKNTMHIEVKYCANSDFGAYKTKTLTNQTLEDIAKNQTLEDIIKNGGKLDDFLSSYLDKNENDKKFAEELKKKLDFPTKTNETTTVEKRRGRPKKEKSDEIIWLEQYFLCLQFYLYLENQFTSNHDNNYLILFRSTGTGLNTNIHSKLFGEYKLVNVKDIDKTAEGIGKFVNDNFIAQNVNRNKVEFTLK